jgi:hypothetical protein
MVLMQGILTAKYLQEMPGGVPALTAAAGSFDFAQDEKGELTKFPSLIR